MSTRTEHRSISGVELKWCSHKPQKRPGEWLLLDSFCKNISYWDGLDHYCRACDSIVHGYKPTGARHHSHRVIDGIEQKYCNNCGRWRTLDFFYSGTGDASGLDAWCEDCRGGYDREWREDNPEQVLDQSHNRRARELEAEGTYTEAEFVALCEYYGNRCLCPDSDHAGPLVPDHVVPLSKGGSNDIGNIQPLCTRHNSIKGTKTIDYRK